MAARDVRRALAKGLTVRLANPVVRPLIERGLVPTAWCLLETTGRRSGLPRRTPVGDGLRGGTFWIVTEHGWASDYVRNIQASPRVRIKRGRRWYAGTAHILPDEDPRARMRALRRPLNDMTVRAVGTEHLVIRVDLDDAQRLTRPRRPTDRRSPGASGGGPAPERDEQPDAGR